MALLKIWRTIRNQGIRSTLRRIVTVGPGYVLGIRNWKVRRCRCCGRITIFMAQRDPATELQTCFFCSANERYELLAMEIGERYGQRLATMNILELDPQSPLRPVLSAARTYTRSFFGQDDTTQNRNGAVYADITALNFKDGSLDLIVSSDVLEHVPRLDRAFAETARVLRPGGLHIFTVPPRAITRKRADIVDGKLKHLEPPDYHSDPLSPGGILAFWDIGPDLPEVLSCPELNIRIVRGPVGVEGRVVWVAERASA